MTSLQRYAIALALALAAFAGAGLFGYQKGYATAKAKAEAKASADEIHRLGAANEDLAALVDVNNIMQEKVNDAITRQQAEIHGLRAAVDGARTAANRLSDTTARASGKLADATRAAAVEYAAIANRVLEESQREYQALAGDADGHAADVRAHRDAWPTLPDKPPVK